jgi:hypothetical protein
MPTVVANAYARAQAWFIGNIRGDGAFPYQYLVELDAYGPGDNEIRQLGASRLLAELAASDPVLVPLHRKNLAFALRRWYRETPDSLAYIRSLDGGAKLGGVATALRTMAASPLFAEYEEPAKRLTRTILSLMREDGSLSPWFGEPPYRYSETLASSVYSGQAVVALVEYAERFGDGQALQAAKRIQRYNIGHYVRSNSAPPIASAPWQLMALASLHRATRDSTYASELVLLTDRLLRARDSVGSDRRLLDDPAQSNLDGLHSSADGVITEGLAHAYGIAKERGDSLSAQRYRRALELAVRNLISLQLTERDVPHGVDRRRAVGAIRSRAGMLTTRIDNTYHAMDAFRKVLSVW